MNFLELEYCEKCKTQECTMPEITQFSSLESFPRSTSVLLYFGGVPGQWCMMSAKFLGNRSGTFPLLVEDF
ncbi:hypothetical protein PAECIP111890_02095 [Paenibacillus sp. JJ-223]|nr:hypothetical protein PAECIP111890_02095 [Paenibacillus sp. JJ-223]